MKLSPEECTTEIEKWIYCIKNMERMKTIPFKNDTFRRLEERARVSNLSTKEYSEYEQSLKLIRDYNNTLTSHFEIGHEEGRIQGRAEGSAEERMAIAKEMLNKGLDKEMIISLTGISDEDYEILNRL